MTDQTPRTDADAIIAEHRPCGPKYDGCYSHVPMPHCRADGMMLPCDVMRLAQARAEGLDVDDCDSIILALEHFPTWFDGTMEKVKAYRAILAGETE